MGKAKKILLGIIIVIVGILAKKIELGIVIVIVGIFVIAIPWAAVWEYYYPEEAELKLQEEAELKLQEEAELKLQEEAELKLQEEAELKLQEEAELKLQEEAELELQEGLKQQEAPPIQKLKELPASCDGVLTTETNLYPTADECVRKIMDRVSNWCLSEEKKIDEAGAEERADICVAGFTSGLAELCEDPATGSTELCVMRTLQDLYPKMIPE